MQALFRFALALPIAMLTYELQAEPQYLGGEEVKLTVRLMNQTSSALAIPDPNVSAGAFRYFVVGPPYPEGKLCASLAGPVELMELAGHATEARHVSLSEMLELSQAGEYRVVSQLEWQGNKIRSNESSFRIEAMKPVSIDLGFGARPLENGEGEGAFITRSGSAAQLYSFEYREVHPGIAETKLEPPIARLALGGEATDVSVPWSNAPFFSDLVRWILWREGRSIKALGSTSRTPLSIDVPEDAAYLVRPSLKPASEPAEVLTVGRDEKTLYLVRMSTKPELAWSIALPAKPVSVTARLAPQGSATRHIALLARTSHGVEMFHSRYSRQGPPEPFRSVRVTGAEPIANAPVALFVDAAGVAHVAALVLLDKATNTVGVAEARFGEGGGVSQPAVATLGALGAAPAAGAVLYVDKGGALTRREVVIALQDGSLLRADAARRLVPAATSGRPTSPLLLAPGQQATYLLYITEKGLALERL